MSDTFILTTFPFGISLNIDIGDLFCLSSASAISIGSVMFLVSIHDGAPLDICSALIPITLAFSNFVSFRLIFDLLLF